MSRIKIDKKQKTIKVPVALLWHIKDQLTAMNQSASHAASWVIPRSHQTSYLIDCIASVLEDAGEKP